MPNEERSSACSEIPASHAAGDQAAPEQESQGSGFGLCDYWFTYQDYDGTSAQAECGKPAVVQVPVDEPDGTQYIVQLCAEHKGEMGEEGVMSDE